MDRSPPPISPITQLLAAAGEGDRAARERLWATIYDELRRVAAQQLARNPGDRKKMQPTTLVHETFLRLLGPDGACNGWANRRQFFAAAAQAMRCIRVEAARRRNRLKRGGPGYRGQAPSGADRVRQTDRVGDSGDGAHKGGAQGGATETSGNSAHEAESERYLTGTQASDHVPGGPLVSSRPPGNGTSSAQRDNMSPDGTAHSAQSAGSSTRPRCALEELAACDPDPLELIALDEALQRLERREPRKAEIVNLRFFAGLSVEQVADVLGLSPRTIELEWRFARAWLHRELAG